MIEKIVGIANIIVIFATIIYVLLLGRSLIKAMVDKSWRRTVLFTIATIFFILTQIIVMGVDLVIGLSFIWFTALIDILSVGVVGSLILSFSYSRSILRKSDPIAWSNVVYKLDGKDPVIWTLFLIFVTGVMVRGGQLFGLFNLNTELQLVFMFIVNTMFFLLIGIYVVGGLYISKFINSELTRKSLLSSVTLLVFVFVSLIPIRLFGNILFSIDYIIVFLLTPFFIFFSIRTMKSFIYSNE